MMDFISISREELEQFVGIAAAMGFVLGYGVCLLYEIFPRRKKTNATGNDTNN